MTAWIPGFTTIDGIKRTKYFSYTGKEFDENSDTKYGLPLTDLTTLLTELLNNRSGTTLE